ncbi:MAG: tRNA dihydrouridine synthase DusB [Verrucomicrobiae bacterium]|nr:tRNA dihydrouridine synthase DusB [Verrucomicrobiae bacterium]
MQLGNLKLESAFFLSPLAGYTNLPFRRIIREIGGVGLCTTELVNARSLLEKNPRAFKYIESCMEDKPLAVQLFGSVVEEMRDAAIYLESIGIHSVDVNMGCPVNKVCKTGGGSSMMRDYHATAELVGQMVGAVKIPVTCKMRLGWDEESITAPDLAKALADVGVAAIFVHGRTREQGFKGRVNLDGIRRVVEAVPEIPVIGNGDVTTPEAAKKMVGTTGCTGISIGRGAFYNPWIFRDIQFYFETGQEPAEKSFDERIKIVRRHLDLMVAFFGEELGCKMFRKVGPWYAKQFGPNALFNERITRLSSHEELEEILFVYQQWRKQFLDDSGNLLPPFQPRSLSSSFLESEKPVLKRDHIPVPAGPVELW